MTVSIIIPNYNGEALLRENLPAVISAAEEHTAKSHQKVEIIITDDGSEDNSRTVVSEISDKITFLEHPQNTGFAVNVNRGVKGASGEIIVLLNTDVRPHKKFLTSLLSHFTHDDVFAVGCLERSHENGKIVERGRGIGSWQKGFLIHAAGSPDKKVTLWASGGSSAYRHALWKRLGGMDELFTPYYWEDIDLSYRAWKAGYRVLFEKESVIDHEHEKGSIRTHEKKKKIQAIAYRNQFLFAWKNMSEANLIIKHLFWLPYHVLSAVKRRDGAFFSGFIRAVGLLPQIVIKRKQLLPQKRTDTEVVNATR